MATNPFSAAPKQAAEADPNVTGLQNAAISTQSKAPGGVGFGSSVDFGQSGLNTSAIQVGNYSPQALANAGRQNSSAEILALGLPGIALGFTDTVGQTFGMWKDDSIANFLRDAQLETMGDFYSRNKEPLRMIGDATGMFIPGTLAVKALGGVRLASEAAILGRTGAASNVARVLLGSSADAASTLANVRASALYMNGVRGLIAGSDFTAQLTAVGAKAITSLPQAKNAANLTALANGIRNGIAFELGVASTMNASELLYPKDFTTFDNLKFASLGVVVGGGLEWAASKYAVSQIIKKVAESSAGINPLADIKGTAAGITKATFRPNDRGVGITLFGTTRQSTDAALATATDANFANSLSTDKTTFGKIITDQFAESGLDPHAIFPQKFEPTDAQKANFLSAVDEDPTTFVGLIKSGAYKTPDEIRASYGEVLTKNQTRIDELNSYLSGVKKPTGTQAYTPAQSMRSELNKLTQTNQDLAAEQHFVITNTGDVQQIHSYNQRWLDDNSFSAIKSEAIDPADITKRTWIAGDVGVDPSFKAVNASGEAIDFAKATYTERSAFFAAASKKIASWAPSLVQEPIKLAADMHWSQLDAIATAFETKPEVAGAMFKFTNDIPNLESLQFTALDGKYREFTGLFDKLNSQPFITKEGRRLTPSLIKDMLNLPDDVAGMPHPTVELFAHLRAQGEETLVDALVNRNSPSEFKSWMDKFGTSQGGIPDMNEMSPPEKLQRLLQEVVDFPSVNAFQRKSLATAGKQFKQTDAKPVMVTSKPIQEMPLSAQKLLTVLENRRNNQLATLIKTAQRKGGFVGAVTSSILESGAFGEAKKVQGLVHGMVEGAGAIVPQNRVAWQNSTLQAMDLVRQNMDHIASVEMDKLLKPAQDARAALANPVNVTSKINFNRIAHSYRFGWDIGRTVEIVPGMVQFELEQTARNKQLWSKFFGSQMPDTGAFLPDMTKGALEKGYTALTADSLAAQAFSSMSKMSTEIGKQNNILRGALGYNPVKLRTWHLPTPDIAHVNKYVIFDKLNQPVHIITGPTKQAAERDASKIVEELNLHGANDPTTNYKFQSWDEVGRYNSVLSDNFQSMIDYSDQILKTGKILSGRLTHAKIDTTMKTFDDMLRVAQSNLIDLTGRTAAVLFEPELNYARLAHTTNAVGSKLGPDIWGRYINMIYGSNTLSPNTTLGPVYQGLENMFDAGLQILTDKLNGVTSKSPWFFNDGKAYSKFQKDMENFDPFGSTEKFIESTYAPDVVPRFGKLASKASAVTSSLVIRFLNAGMAVLNLGGVAATFPSVIRALQRGVGESHEDWLKRIGAYGSRLTEDTAAFNVTRATTGAVHSLFTGELDAPIKLAIASGQFTPEFEHVARDFAMHTEGTWNSRIDSFLDAAHYLSDKSEYLSRYISWAMGYKIGKDGLKIGKEIDRVLFANKFVTDMIGDYRVSNRPQMFQGSIGTPLGMFQTFMFNYYRRLYGYIERKDFRSVVAQYGAQAALFGVQSVPGFDQFSDIFYRNYNGTTNPVDTIRNNISEDAADLILEGSISNLPKLFGADTGIAFNTSGNANIRIPSTILNPQDAPVAQVAGKVFGFARDSIGQFMQGGQFSWKQQQEILAQYMVNRPLKKALELAAGYSVDASGQVINEDTNSTMSIIASAFAANTTQQQQLQEGFMRNKASSLSNSAITNRLSESVRAKIRAGDINSEFLANTIRDYIKSGHDPRGFASWMRQNFMVAQQSKYKLKYIEALKSGDVQSALQLAGAIQPDLSDSGE